MGVSQDPIAVGELGNLQLDHLGKADDRVQGSTQLVADMRQKFVLGAIGILGPRFRGLGARHERRLLLGERQHRLASIVLGQCHEFRAVTPQERVPTALLGWAGEHGSAHSRRQSFTLS